MATRRQAERSGRENGNGHPRMQQRGAHMDDEAREEQEQGRSRERRGQSNSGAQSGALEEMSRSSEEGIERLESAFSAFWREAAGDGAQPVTEQAARANIELIGLVARRGRAVAELPARLSRCRSPQDLWIEQLRFMRAMMHDYQNMTARMFDAAVDTAAVASEQMDTLQPSRERRRSDGKR